MLQDLGGRKGNGENTGKPAWRLLATHGLLLFHVSSHAGSTVRDLIRALDITERQVRRVVGDLLSAHLLCAEEDPDRSGRFIYRIGPALGYGDRTPELSGFKEILRLLETDPGSATV